jgi:hypothetical protein
MEDSLSIKKTAEEEKEDREIAEKVNATLAEEKEKERLEEEEKKKRQDQGKKKEDEKKKGGQEKVKKDEIKAGSRDKKLEDRVDLEDQDEACPTNITCPVVDPCPEEKTCPEQEDCPEIQPCPEEKTCRPCPVANLTMGPPSTPGCPEPASMSVLEAMAVGAIASLLITGVATAIGLLLRYTSPIFSGLLFIFIVVLTWYLSSHYPETARELGGRVVATLREASIALGHRVMEAIRHHNEQVGLNLIFLLPDLSSIVSKRFALRFSM